MSILALFGIKTLTRPAILAAVALLAIVFSGAFGAWWGLSSNRQAALAWKARAGALQVKIERWEELTARDSKVAENDRVVIKKAEKIVEAQNINEGGAADKRAIWTPGDVRVFKQLRGITGNHK